MLKEHRENKKLIEHTGLKVVDIQPNGPACIWLLRAPNGQEKVFTTTDTSDPFARKNNIAQWRRFLRENTPPPVTPLATAMAKAVKVPLEDRYLQEEKEHQIVDEVMNYVETSKPPAKPPQETKMPITENKVSDDALQSIAANARATVTPDKEQKMKKTRVVSARLSMVQFAKMCEWARTADMKGIYTQPQLAAAASKAMGWDVATSTMADLIEAAGLTLDKKELKRPSQAGRFKGSAKEVVIDQVNKILVSLGVPPTPEFKRLLENRDAE